MTLPLDWIGFVFSVSGFFLNAKKIIWCWVVWMTGNFLWTSHWAYRGEWVAVGLLVFFQACNIYGFHSWKNNNEMKATCTWGDRLDVLVSLNGIPAVLHQNPLKESWTFGMVGRTSIGLTKDEALKLAGELTIAAHQVDELKTVAKDYDNESTTPSLKARSLLN